MVLLQVNFKVTIVHMEKMKEIFFSPIDRALFESRVVQISGPINSSLAYRVTRELLAMEKMDSNKPIIVFVNSPGGEVTSGFSVFDTIRFIAPEVKTVVTGLAASMGSLISLAAKKGNRQAFPNSKFLIHQPLISGVIQGPASDLEIHAKDIVKTREKINRIYSKETGKSFEVVTRATDRDYWMTAEEALEFGLISKIVTAHSEI